MRKLSFILPALLVTVGLLAGCDSYVEDVDLPIDSIEDAQLTTESQVPFLISGVQTRFATTYDRLALFSDGLSDQFIFDQRVPNATFPTFREMDEGDIQFANNSVDGVYNDLGELRFFSDNLLERIAEIQFEDADLQKEAQFTGTFFGGVARYLFATYIGLTPREGGGVIDAGPFIPADQMYGQALEKLNAASAFASDYERRVINTIIARIHLYQGDFGAARAAAQSGLVDGDAPFRALYGVESSNEYWSQAGRGRNQWVVEFPLADVVDADPAEFARIPLDVIAGNDGTETTPATTFFRQAKYTDRPDPIVFASWQENELILAELDLRDGSAGSAVDRINAVRASFPAVQVGDDTFQLAPLAAVDQDVLIVERERSLFATGLRLADQRRFDIWHLGDGTWQFLPITQSERNQNENL